MKTLVFLSIFLLTLLAAFNGMSQLPDSSHRDTTATSASWQNEDNTADDDFAPGLLFMALIGISLVCVCIGIGSILTITLLLLLFSFVLLGILSSSVFVGLNRRSFTSGFKTFVVSTFSIGGIGLGISLLYLTNYLFNLHLSHTTTLWMGGGVGLVAGVLLGLLSFILLQQLLGFFKQRIGLS